MTQQNDYGFPRWLQYLLSVCRPNWKISGLGNEHTKALALLDTFYDEDAEKMTAAVKSYLATKRDAYLPFPGELAAHFVIEPYKRTRESRAFHIWHRDEVAATWPICPRCEEHTPNVNNCPLCADLVAEGQRVKMEIAEL